MAGQWHLKSRRDANKALFVSANDVYRPQDIHFIYERKPCGMRFFGSFLLFFFVANLLIPVAEINKGGAACRLVVPFVPDPPQL